MSTLSLGHECWNCDKVADEWPSGTFKYLVIVNGNYQEPLPVCAVCAPTFSDASVDVGGIMANVTVIEQDERGNASPFASKYGTQGLRFLVEAYISQSSTPSLGPLEKEIRAALDEMDLRLQVRRR